MRTRRLGVGKVVIYGLLVLYAVWTLFPIIWVILTSFKTNNAALSVPPAIVFRPTLANYPDVFNTVSQFPDVIANSVVIAAVGTAAIVLLAVPAAYGLSRLIPVGRQFLGFGIMAARTFPTIGLAIPLFLLMESAHLLDTRVSVIAANVAFSLPFGIWMIYGFVESVPIELEEAGTIDGCGRLGILLRVVLPQLLPGIGGTALLTAIVAWREYLFPLILTTQNARTLPTVAGSFITDYGTNWGGLCAYAVMTMIPVAIFSGFAGKYLARGFTGGALKG
jgi:multiple sugar transport system permease protein